MGRILVIEDEPGTQILLQSRLQDLGHEVVTAPTGAMGLMEARAGGFDLFLIDVQLGPGVDGYEVCRRLKSMPGAQSVPLVLLSGRVRDRGELHSGYEAGCDAYLLKGEDPLIEDVVRAMLRLKALRDELARQNQLLEQQNQRLERTKATANGADAPADPTIAPDAVLMVDADGVVIAADRGATTLFQTEVQGRQLGRLAAGTGLEGWVRDSRAAMRSGHLFALPERGGVPARRISATVAPLPGAESKGGAEVRIVLMREVNGSAKEEVANGARWMQIEQAEELRLAFQPSALVGRSEATHALRGALTRHAPETQPLVLAASTAHHIRLMARILHHSAERKGSMVPVSCDVLEAEGAGLADFRGLLEKAAGGTLLLEEADRLTAHRRRALKELTSQTGSARLILGVSGDRGGSTALAEELGLERLELPPLSERSEDVGPLAEFFLVRDSGEDDPRTFSDEALLTLEYYSWVGDEAELERVVAEACRVATGNAIEVDDLPAQLRDVYAEMAGRGTIQPVRSTASGPAGTHRAGDPLAGTIAFQIPSEGDLRLEMGEPLIIHEALRRTGQNVKEAASLLGIGRSTLYRKLKEHGLR